MSYPFKEIEEKWLKLWDENKTYITLGNRLRPKYYVLDMFPYPSGQGLHVGHLKGYVASDVISRFKRMQGYSVLHPMGWDAFGLPAERQAKKENLHPEELVKRNIRIFRNQLHMVGLSYDWDREFSTTDEDYYKWTQWLFKRLYEQGLAYQACVPVNWCPAQGTVLANEEVKNGRYIETGEPVERRVMKQWLLKITAYSDRLIDDLDEVDWPESVKEMQRNWIGRSEGANISFPVKGSDISIDVFTTRPDTLFGASYVVLAPEHPLIGQLTNGGQKESVERYIAEALQKTERDRQTDINQKTGVFTGAKIINPINGEELPVLVSDYVLAGAGTGAVFGCPAHDQRDYDFASVFDLPIKPVIMGGNIEEEAYVGDGVHINSEFLNGLNTTAAKEKAIQWLEDNGAGSAMVTYRLRDWLFSRQRYWGEPFPFVYDEAGNVRPVPDSALPVKIPLINDWRNVRGELTPLAACKEWVNTVDPETGLPAARETNTMPQWAGSSWYYLRFCDPKNGKEPWSRDAESYWLPVDLYVGGVEHATLHLLYARFWHKVMYDLGLVSTKEPFKKLFNQGMITARSYKDAQGKYYYPEQVENREESWFIKGTNTQLETRVEKMSKSKNNVIRPDDIIAKYGADTLRLFEMFIGPVEKGGVWQDEQIVGVHRFLERVHKLYENSQFTPKNDAEMDKILHRSIKKISDDVESMNLNTAVSQLMVLSTEIGKRPHTKETLVAFTTMLSPFAPFIAEEGWQKLGMTGSIAHASWPDYSADKAREEAACLAIQINGKVKGRLSVEKDVSQDEIWMLIEKDKELSKIVRREDVKKLVHVSNKIISLVL